MTMRYPRNSAVIGKPSLLRSSFFMSQALFSEHLINFMLLHGSVFRERYMTAAKVLSSMSLRVTRFKNLLFAKYNAQIGVFAVEFKSSVGLGAKLEWCLEIIAYCDDHGLIPQIKFSFPNSDESDDHFGCFFRINGAVDNSNLPRFIKVSSIAELNLGKEYDRLLNIELASLLINKYLVVREEIVSEVDEFCFEHFANRTILGVHYRGTDKGEESPIVPYDRVTRNIEHYIKLHADTDGVFVASDDVNFIEYIEKASLSRPILYRNDSYRARDGKSIHKSAITDKYEITRDALVNCLLLSRCDALLKTASILSAWSKLFSPRLPVVMLNRPYGEFQWFPERDLLDNTYFKPIN